MRCFGSWAPPPLHPPRIHLTSFTWWMLPGLPRFNFLDLPIPYIIVNVNGRSKREIKTGKAWDRGYMELDCRSTIFHHIIKFFDAYMRLGLFPWWSPGHFVLHQQASSSWCHLHRRSNEDHGSKCTRLYHLATKDASHTIDSVNLPSMAMVIHDSLTQTGTYTRIAFTTPCPGILFQTSKLIP